jgi:hypothetical protein
MFGRLVQLCGVLATLVACRVAAGADWRDQRQAGRFQLHADYSLEGSEALVRELEQLQRDMAAALGLSQQATPSPIHLILFRDRPSYDRYMEHYFPGAPQRRAMFIQGSAPGWVFAYRHPDFEVDLRHETVHALLHSDLPTVPLWLDEGIAEYYEVAADARVYGNAYLPAIKRNAWLFRVPALSRLESLQDMSRMGTPEYQDAWSWVHFMLHGPADAHRVLIEYVADLRVKGNAGSLEDRLHVAVPDFEKQYLKHFRNWHR